MIRLIASDMDGTLLNSSHLITDETVRAIKEAQQDGILFVITTGRMYEDACADLQRYGIGCEYLTMNGAKLVDSEGKTLQVIDIDRPHVLSVLDYLNQKDLYVELYTSDGVYTTSEDACIQDALLAKYSLFYPDLNQADVLKDWQQLEQYRHLKRIDQVEELFERNIEISKILSFSQDEAVIQMAREDLGRKPEIAVAASFACNLEVTDREAQKGRALERFAKSKGIGKHEIMAIGDSYNDLSMLRENFGATIAMGNAIAEVKEVVRYVTYDNDNHGVAFAINCAISNKLHLLRRNGYGV